ncbi:MAG: hypothetical protein QOE29_2001 [Gaiellaceae bacterium]|jgi:hypothetical protein|nr:hypothetical protein [Gaiellaceae bacterium]
MTQLEQQLRELGTTLFPAEPDIQAAVRAQLGPQPVGRRYARPVLLLAGLLLATLVAALAIPQARSALERWLGIGAARIERVDRLPKLHPGIPLRGRPATLAQARRAFGRPLLLPTELGPPDEIRIAPGLGVVFGWEKPVRVRLLEVVPGGSILKKLVTVDSTVHPLYLDGRLAVWIEGRHGVQFNLGQPEIAGNALIWESGDVTLRLDGKIGEALALKIARTVHS